MTDEPSSVTTTFQQLDKLSSDMVAAARMAQIHGQGVHWAVVGCWRRALGRIKAQLEVEGCEPLAFDAPKADPVDFGPGLVEALQTAPQSPDESDAYTAGQPQCPQFGCGAEIDVVDEFDGAELSCPSCGLSCWVVVSTDGSWNLHPGEDE